MWTRGRICASGRARRNALPIAAGVLSPTEEHVIVCGKERHKVRINKSIAKNDIRVLYRCHARRARHSR